MPPIPHRVQVTDHPGSSLDEIWNEPDWTDTRSHRVGYNNIQQGRRPGLTHDGDESLEENASELQNQFRELQNEAKKGHLLNFRDVMHSEKDLNKERPETRPYGWRFVLEASEDGIKSEEWPANIQKKKKEEKDQKEKEDSQGQNGPLSSKAQDGQRSEGDEEHDFKRAQGDEASKHHDAYATPDDQDTSDSQQQVNENTNRDTKKSDSKPKSEHEQLREKYSEQEIALLKSLQHERDYIQRLGQNNGRMVSPMKGQSVNIISIDEADQFSPDNWIPRDASLMRLTGKHPLNAEPNLDNLFQAGLITPNHLHYVRNHGAVPQLRWEFHRLDIENGKFVLTMDQIKEEFDTINIPVALACDGNRRKELNMIKKSKGFNWGSGSVSCAYWKGPLLRDVLLRAGIPEDLDAYEHGGQRHWVNFEGADQPSEGKYSTCIPLQYAMDPMNDVILAYEMNDAPLPPDHGYPLRVMIPGYVGGRCVKWVNKIWISDKENESYYHIWDNRVLPSFVTEKDGEFARTLFHHPDTACNEQNLNSVIVKPAQGEEVKLSTARKGATYRVEGYAYDGGGHEVQRVEISLDDGNTWLYCIRKYPDYPVRHGNKFWTWLHWHVDVSLVHLIQAPSVIVRCFNVFKNTQPREASWNVMGMMNNCWYQVKGQVATAKDGSDPVIRFRHPTEPGTGDGGWMKQSFENELAQVKQTVGTPQKQFTRQEIEKHNTEDDCWIVVDGKVYDATSVLSWHPGGKAAVLAHAGKVHQEASNEFASIHDGYAYQKLNECALGVVTEKTMKLIKQTAEEAAKQQQNSRAGSQDYVLQKHRWVPVKLTRRQELSKDTRTYTFQLPPGKKYLGLGTCQHVQIGYHLMDKMVIRSYTPSRPLLAAETKSDGDPEADSQRDGVGSFDLTVKTYYPDENQPGGAMSNILDCLELGETIDIRGPTGDITYEGYGNFKIGEEDETFSKVNLILGGSGITPGYALLMRVLLTKGDNTQIRVVDANKSEADILLKESLEALQKKHAKQIKITHVLSHPSESWKGIKGHVNEDIIRKNMFEPSKDTVTFLCGPPAMIQKAALPALTNWGFEEDKNCFGF